jgi:hypothetical protein
MVVIKAGSPEETTIPADPLQRQSPECSEIPPEIVLEVYELNLRMQLQPIHDLFVVRDDVTDDTVEGADLQ